MSSKNKIKRKTRSSSLLADIPSRSKSIKNPIDSSFSSPSATPSTKFHHTPPKFQPEYLSYCKLPKSNNKTWTTEINGHPVSFNYQIHGQDSAPQKIVFINGMTTSLTSHSCQAEYLLKHPAVIQAAYLDNRGVGYSSPLSETYNTSSFAKDAFNFIKNCLGWSEFHLYGNSMGGMIIQHLLCDIDDYNANISLSHNSQHLPIKIKSVIFSNTHYGSWINLLLTPPSCISTYIRTLFQSTKETMIWSVMDLLYPPQHLELPPSPDEKNNFNSRREELYIKKMAYSNHSRSPTLISTLSHLSSSQTHHLSHNQVSLIASLHFPKYVIVSEEDGMVNSQATKDFAIAINADFLISVPNSGHCPHNQYPELLNPLLHKILCGGNLNGYTISDSISPKLKTKILTLQ